MLKKIKLQNKLMLVITATIFTSSLLIATIVLSQYKTTTLRQAEVDMVDKASELQEFGEDFYSERLDNRAINRFYKSVTRITEYEFWIFSLNNGMALTSGYQFDEDELVKLIDELKNNSEPVLTYQFSEHFDAKTLTVVSPILDEGNVLGATFLHRDVNVIYNSYNHILLLVVISIIISTFLSLIISYFLAKKITKPLKKITSIAEEISSGKYDVKTDIEADDEIGILARTIDSMSDKINKDIASIRNLEQSVKNLVVNVSHEFKTPLTIIKGNAENIFYESVDNATASKRIIENVDTLEVMVNELLELSKYENGIAKLNKTNFNVTNLIEEIVYDFKTIHPNKKIDLKVDENIKLLADKDKIRQLLIIIIDNAIKYTADDGMIDIDLSAHRLTIKDDGVGINKDEIDKIYDRFEKFNNNSKGQGIGMNIAKHIIDSHDFNIEINSVKGQGTEINVIFNNI